MKLDGEYKAPDRTIIHYHAERKVKPWVVMLHGWALNHSALEGIRKPLARKGFSTLTLDIRGHGKSQSDLVSIELAVKDLGGILRKEKIGKAILVGFSMGGMIAQRFCAEHPHKVEALVLISTNFISPAKTFPAAARRMLSDFIVLLERKELSRDSLSRLFDRVKAATKAARLAYQKAHGRQEKISVDYMKLKGKTDIEVFNEGLKETDIRSVQGYYEEQVRLDIGDGLEKIKAPCLIISSLGDVVCPVEAAREMARRINGSELRIIKGSDHLTVLQKAPAINALIDDFLAKIYK